MGVGKNFYRLCLLVLLSFSCICWELSKNGEIFMAYKITVHNRVQNEKTHTHKADMCEMAFDRKEIMSEAKGQLMPLLKHWILVRYATLNEPDHQDIEHWQDELVAAIWNVGMMNLKKGNKRETVKRAINEMYFTKMELQNKSFHQQISKICEREHISLDVSEYDAAFKNELPKIVDVMASGDYDNVWKYIDTIAK